MCQSSTTRRLTGAAAATLVWLLAAGPIPAQPLAQGVTVTPDWRRIGNAAVDVSLTSVATGPVDRVWYSESGDRLLARTQSGNVFVTRDWETWAAAAGESEPLPAQAPDAPAAVTPEEGASVRVARGSPTILYALGRAVHRSDDGGLNWTNLTEYRRQSILGDGLGDLAVSPRDDDEIVVAGRYGIWRSVDGGLSWSGLNDLLPNLPVQRLLGLPGRGRGTRVLLDGIGEAEWAPGEKHAWRPVSENELGRELQLRRSLSATLGARILAVAASGDYLYAGSAGAGRLWASSDRGLSWRSFTLPGAGPVERIFALPGNPRVALAALGTGSEPADRAAHVLRTTNGGIFWDDLTANLPDVAAHGITADAATGGVYVATDGGVFFTVADLLGAAPATDWTSLSAGLPSAAAEDVRLDGEANQLYVAVEGEGVFAAQAPHRSLAPAVVNAADLHARAASPGVLLSVLGGKVRAARAGQLDVPVLAAGDVESQIQVPFEVKGSASRPLTETGRPGASRSGSRCWRLRRRSLWIMTARR